jgi:cell division protein FtsB
MSPRRRNGGGGHGHEPQAAPRVRGAWKTPAVVVRAPDGSVVNRPARPTRGPSGRVPGAAPNGDAGRRRIPPPGVTGGVLAAPSRAVATRPKADGSRRALDGRRQREPKTDGRRRPLPSPRPDRLAPIDEEARERRNARLRWLGTRVGSVALSGLLVYAVFPVRTYLNQRSDTNRAREQLNVLSQENERLEQQADDLRDPETIEEIARRDHNLVMPGEESYGILPPPEPAPDSDTTGGPEG